MPQAIRTYQVNGTFPNQGTPSTSINLPRAFDIERTMILESNQMLNTALQTGSFSTELRGLGVVWTDSSTLELVKGPSFTNRSGHEYCFYLVESLVPGGPYDFIVRDRLDIGTFNPSGDVDFGVPANVVNLDKCIPIVSKIIPIGSDSNKNSSYPGMPFFSGGNVFLATADTIHSIQAEIQVVEFVGKNWLVGHAKQTILSNTGTHHVLDLFTQADGQGGTPFVAPSTSSCLPFGKQRSSNHDQRGRNVSVEMLNTTQVQAIRSDGVANGPPNPDIGIHVLCDLQDDMVVTLYSFEDSNWPTSFPVDITSAGLTDLEQSYCIAYSYETGQNHFSKSLNRIMRFNSLVEAEVISSNTSDFSRQGRLHIADFSGMEGGGRGQTILIT